jgi:ATP-dependent DNA ligase
MATECYAGSTVDALPSGAETVRKEPSLRETHWTEPKTIAEVAFMEWTSDGSIRHPSFQGLREDKNPKDVSREVHTGNTDKRKKQSGSPRPSRK